MEDDEIIIEEQETDSIELDETPIDDVELGDEDPILPNPQNYVSYKLQNKTEEEKQQARNNIKARKDIINLGIIETDYEEETQEDVLNRIEELTENGDYTFQDSDGNGFYVHTEITYYEEQKIILQYYWTTEEPLGFKRFGYENTEGEIEWNGIETIATYETISSSFAPRNHNHYTTENTTSISNWLNEFKTNTTGGNPASIFRIKYNGQQYDVQEWWHNETNKNYRSQKYFNENNPNEVYARNGNYAGNSVIWEKWTKNLYVTDDEYQSSILSWVNTKTEEGLFEAYNNIYTYKLENTIKGNYLYQRLKTYRTNGNYEEKIRKGIKNGDSYTFESWNTIISI